MYGLLRPGYTTFRGVQLQDSPPAAVGDPSVAAVAGVPSTATIAADPSAAAVAGAPSTAAAVASAPSAAAGIGRRICLDLLGFVFTLSLGICLRWALLLMVMDLSLCDLSLNVVLSLEDLAILSLSDESKPSLSLVDQSLTADLSRNDLSLVASDLASCGCCPVAALGLAFVAAP